MGADTIVSADKEGRSVRGALFIHTHTLRFVIPVEAGIYF